MKTDVSIIVLNYCDFDTTVTFVDEASNWSHDSFVFRIIVVDNCSPDGSGERLSKHYSSISTSTLVDVVVTKDNGGYASGNNAGIRFAIGAYQSRYIVISNPDIKVNQEVVIECVSVFEKNDSLGLVAPTIMALDGSIQAESISLPTFNDDWAACGIRERFPNANRDPEYLDSEKRIMLTEMVPGCFYLARASALQKIGLLDEGTFLYCEERILGRRMRDKGYIAAICLDLFVVHAHSVTIRKAMDVIASWRLIMESRLYYQKKYNAINGTQALLLGVRMKIYIAKIKIFQRLRLNKGRK